MDDVKKVTEEKKADSDAAKKELDAAIVAQDKQSGVVQEQYESVYGAKDQDYQNLLKLKSNLETEIPINKLNWILIQRMKRMLLRI